MKRLSLIAVALLLSAFAVFVWPTRYRYGQMAADDGTPFPVRFDRISGNADRLTKYGWAHLRPPRPASAEPAKLVPCEEAQASYAKGGALAVRGRIPEDCDLAEAMAQYECGRFRTRAISTPSVLKYSDAPLGCDVSDLIAEYRRAGGYSRYPR
jgi:hypothetical protein